MKITLPLIVAVSIALAACTSAQPTGTQVSLDAGQLAATPVQEQEEAALPAGTATNDGRGEGLADVLAEQTQAPDSGAGPKQPEPEVSWDTSPEALVVSATNCCGFVPEFVQLNYIPEALIWGDGRIIWTQVGPDNERLVQESRLIQEQMAGLLQQAVEAGFFGWEELYTDPMAPSDLPSRCLFIQLQGESRQVCEYYQGAPEAFHEIFDALESGLGVTGQPYTPGEGYLVSYPIDTSGEVTSQPETPDWDAAALGVSMAEAASGAWIDGQALEQAWQLVNETPFGTIVQEEGALYQISLQIPGVSFVEPPSR